MLEIKELKFMPEPREAVSGVAKKGVRELDFKLMLDRAQDDRGRERMRAPSENEEEDFQEPVEVDEGAREANKDAEGSAESQRALPKQVPDEQEESAHAGEDATDGENNEQVLYPLVAAVAQEVLADAHRPGEVPDQEQEVVLKTGLTESTRMVQEVDRELDVLDLDSQLFEGRGAQAPPLVEGMGQNSQNVFDMLSFNEMMDPELVVDQIPNQIVNRIQQAATTANAPILQEAADVVLPQVVRGLATLVRDGMAEMRLQLEPADLGEIELRVRTMDGVVRGQMMVQQAEVKQLLDAQLNRLREALEEHGLELGGLDVGLARDQHPGDSHESDQGRKGSFSGRPGFDADVAREEGAQPRRIVDGEVDYLI